MKNLNIDYGNTKENWDEANAWLRQLNHGIDITPNNNDEYSYPVWVWDCNFKLNFDGQLSDMEVDSRFY